MPAQDAPAVWPAGTTVVLREVWRDRTWSLRPATVVSENGGSAVLWIPEGTRWRAPTVPQTRPRAASRAERLTSSLALEEWELVDRLWDVSTLWFVEPGADHCVWVSWDANGNHLGWYINLQQPFVRTDDGFDWMDMMLDVIVSPDRSWRWKDEDEFEALIDRGLIDDATVERIRSAAIVALDHLALGVPPFDGAWLDWRPDPTWSLPTLPPQLGAAVET